MTRLAVTEGEALVLVATYLEKAHPNTTFRLVEETRGGGLDGPWVFQFAPVAKTGPLLVKYGEPTVIPIASHPHGLKRAVQAWEIATYGSLQR